MKIPQTIQVRLHNGFYSRDIRAGNDRGERDSNMARRFCMNKFTVSHSSVTRVGLTLFASKMLPQMHESLILFFFCFVVVYLLVECTV